MANAGVQVQSRNSFHVIARSDVIVGNLPAIGQ